MSEALRVKILSIVKKLAADKKTAMIIALGVAGMLLIAFSGSETKETEYNTENYSINNYQYIKQQSEQLKELISNIEGVGKVEVMITVEGSSETVFAQDVSEQNDENGNKTNKEYIIIDNGSDEDGLKVKELYPEVKGVAVVCQGGNNPVVKNEITSLLRALFNISSNSISVVAMK